MPHCGRIDALGDAATEEPHFAFPDIGWTEVIGDLRIEWVVRANRPIISPAEVLEPLTVERGLAERMPLLLDTGLEGVIGAVIICAGIGKCYRLADQFVSKPTGAEGEKNSPRLVKRGARERLAPILMTTLATALALVPLVVARNLPGHEIEHPMAVVILGGLVISTLLSLLIVPSLYLRFGADREGKELKSQLDGDERPA